MNIYIVGLNQLYDIEIDKVSTSFLDNLWTFASWNIPPTPTPQPPPKKKKKRENSVCAYYSQGYDGNILLFCADCHTLCLLETEGD